MSRRKKNNVISLLDYLKKKKKPISKKSSKAASDESDFFSYSDKTENLKKSKKSHKSSIIYMSNYLKEKELPPENKEHSQSTPQEQVMGKILDFPIERKANKAYPRQKQNTLSKPISLDEFRKTKKQVFETKEKSTPKQIVKEAMSFTAMAMAFLLAFTVFFPNGESPLGNNTIAQEGEGAQRKLASPNEKPFFIKGTKVDKKDSKIIRRISSIFVVKDLKTNKSNGNYIQKIRKINPEDEIVILGGKPNSSNYKGF